MVSAIYSRQAACRGHYRRAQPIRQAALQKNPLDTDALIALSTIEWAYGQLESATVLAEKAVVTANQSAIAHAQLANILGAGLASSKTGTLEKLSLARLFRRPHSDVRSQQSIRARSSGPILLVRPVYRGRRQDQRRPHGRSTHHSLMPLSMAPEKI